MNRRNEMGGIRVGRKFLKIFPGRRSPWLSFYNTRRRVEYLQVEHKGVGGEEEEKLLFLCKLFDI